MLTIDDELAGAVESVCVALNIYIYIYALYLGFRVYKRLCHILSH